MRYVFGQYSNAVAEDCFLIQSFTLLWESPHEEGDWKRKSQRNSFGVAVKAEWDMSRFPLREVPHAGGA